MESLFLDCDDDTRGRSGCTGVVNVCEVLLLEAEPLALEAPDLAKWPLATTPLGSDALPWIPPELDDAGYLLVCGRGLTSLLLDPLASLW